MAIASRSAQLVVGVDTGGTFTDVTLVNPATGQSWAGKTPSTPEDPSLGFGQAIAAVLKVAGASASDIGRVLHGTTVATNLILENKGAATALITNAGFRYVLEIGRNDVPRGSSLFSWIKPKRPVAPHHIFEVAGRLDPRGDEVEPLDEFALGEIAGRIEAAGINTIAVVFLHSYANPRHEQRAAQILERLHPAASISLSSDVLPVFREYERSMATILNATVKPVVGDYIARLERRLTDLGVAAPLLLMKSNGGVASARRLRTTPVETALSGPAAGTVGASAAGAAAGHRDLIAIDIGGTSADISLIRDADPSLTMRGRIGDWPLALPTVDIRTIGAGGGSIARVSSSGTLTVGPESAGAQPGPACYGRGGTEPTVTDANLVLGYLPPHLLGGSFRLDAEAARRAIVTRIAEPLGMTVDDAARGILAIVNHHMVGAIRLVSIERGHDPRDFALLAFGGAGPLHGGALARLLDIRTIVVPPAPGVLSATGLLISNVKAEFARTVEYAGGRLNIEQIGSTFDRLGHQALSWLDDERVPGNVRRITKSAALRYRNQGFELFVPWSGDKVDATSLAATIQAFHTLHEQL